MKIQPPSQGKCTVTTDISPDSKLKPHIPFKVSKGM